MIIGDYNPNMSILEIILMVLIGVGTLIYVGILVAKTFKNKKKKTNDTEEEKEEKE